MIKIFVSLSKNSQDHSRPEKHMRRWETDGELAKEDSKEFIRKRKKRKKKVKRNQTIPDPAFTEPGADNNGRVRISKANWLGRLERDPKPRHSRELELKRNVR